jgi:hypothetical protein
MSLEQPDNCFLCCAPCTEKLCLNCASDLTNAEIILIKQNFKIIKQSLKITDLLDSIEDRVSTIERNQ